MNNGDSTDDGDIAIAIRTLILTGHLDGSICFCLAFHFWTNNLETFGRLDYRTLFSGSKFRFWKKLAQARTFKSLNCNNGKGCCFIMILRKALGHKTKISGPKMEARKLFQLMMIAAIKQHHAGACLGGASHSACLALAALAYLISTTLEACQLAGRPTSALGFPSAPTCWAHNCRHILTPKIVAGIKPDHQKLVVGHHSVGAPCLCLFGGL